MVISCLGSALSSPVDHSYAQFMLKCLESFFIQHAKDDGFRFNHIGAILIFVFLSSIFIMLVFLYPSVVAYRYNTIFIMYAFVLIYVYFTIPINIIFSSGMSRSILCFPQGVILLLMYYFLQNIDLLMVEIYIFVPIALYIFITIVIILKFIDSYLIQDEASITWLEFPFSQLLPFLFRIQISCFISCQ